MLKFKLLFLFSITLLNIYSQEKLNPVNSCFGNDKSDYYKFLNSKLITIDRDLEVARLIIIPYKEAESSLTLQKIDLERTDSYSDYYELVFTEADGSVDFAKKRNWRKISFKTSTKEISAEFGTLLSNLYEKVLETTSYPFNETTDTHRSMYFFSSSKTRVMEGYTFEPFDENSMIGSVIDLNYSIILYVKVGGKELENKIISKLKELNKKMK